MSWINKRRFVLMEDGQEINWVDPVDSFHEDKYQWIVENGFGTYIFAREPNRTIKFQRLGWVDDE